MTGTNYAARQPHGRGGQNPREQATNAPDGRRRSNPDKVQKRPRERARARSGITPKKYIYIPRSKRNFSTVCGSKETGPGRLRASEVEARRGRCSSNRRRQSGRIFRRTGSRMARELRGGWWRGRGTAAAKNALSNTQKRPRCSYLKQSKSEYSGHYSELVYNFK